MSSSEIDPLISAVEALDTLAAGLVPERLSTLAGALALSTLCKRITPDRDLIDAAAGLDALASGRELDLNEEGRARAAKLAERVRRELPHASDDASS
ncbi:MAG: hypothetical protein ABI145_08605 [Steroidobacteraceae bacterium]